MSCLRALSQILLDEFRREDTVLLKFRLKMECIEKLNQRRDTSQLHHLILILSMTRPR